MLLTRQTHQPARPQLNMASMIDVVFLLLLLLLLLIFFMCTSSFEKFENDLPTQVPQAGAGQNGEEDFEPVNIRLVRRGDGVLVMFSDQPCGTMTNLMKKLHALRAIKDVPIIIEVESGVPFGEMVAVLDSCHQAQFQRVAFSVKGVGK